MNNITKTIIQNLEDFESSFNKWQYDYVDWDWIGYGSKDFQKPLQGFIKSHLLQSQINVIEAVIESLKSMYKNFYSSDERYAIQINKDYEDYTALHGLNVYNKALEDQISSLNETLEELKKSL